MTHGLFVLLFIFAGIGAISSFRMAWKHTRLWLAGSRANKEFLQMMREMEGR